MIKNITLVMLISCSLTAINAQVGIGTTEPDPSSELHIESNDSGLLIPRLTTTQRDAILSPANGLLIFNTDTDEIQINTNTTITPIWEAFTLTTTTTSTPGQSVKYSNTDISTNINNNTAINLPVCGVEEWNDNTTLYNVDVTSNSITINETGRYRVIVNASIIVANNGPQRANPEIYIALDDVQVGTVSSHGYMRRAGGHNEASVNFTEVIEITTGQALSLKVLRVGNVGVVNLRAASTTNLYIEKIL
ncbi:hypothetical protein [Winogradskyella sp. PE311]|uniref:hypothetical protein n=1 Tax=Winogradskyella sp. PE311 TaxID=3366943 RepID=UPI003980360B